MSYECDVCGRTFASASNRLRHKKVVHENVLVLNDKLLR